MIKIERSIVSFENIILVIIALAAMNFMLYGSYLVMVAFIICLMGRRGNIYLNTGAMNLIILAICYIIFSTISSGNINFRIIAAPCAFLVAYNLDFKKLSMIKMLLIIACAMALHSIISFINILSTQGLGYFLGGQNFDIWSEDLSAATGTASYYFFMAATLPILLMRGKWYHFVLFGICLLHDILIGGRTFIVLCGIAIIATLIFRTFCEKKHIRTFNKYILIIAIITVVLIIFYINNIFDIRTIIESSYMWKRFFIDNSHEEIFYTSRWERKAIYLQNLFRYPFGGNHLLNDLKVGYAHDIWLDTFDKSGIITMILMLVYTLSSAVRFFKYAKTVVNMKDKVVFYVFPIVLLSSFLVEPIMEGAPMVFFMYCFMDGLIYKKSDLSRSSL